MLEDLHDLRQHVDEEGGDHDERDTHDDRRIQQRQRELGAQRLPVLEIVGELGEHARQLARRFPRGDERAVELGENIGEGRERLGDRAAGDHLAAQRSQHLPRALVLGLLDQRVECLLDGKTRFEKRSQAAGEMRDLGRRERDAPKARAGRGIVGGDDLDAIGREPLVAQRRARLACAVGLEHALVELALDAVGLVLEAGHLPSPRPSPKGEGGCHVRVR